MASFPILMYHRIVSGECPVPANDPEEARYAVTVEDFAAQLDWLAGQRMHAVSMERAHECLCSGARIPETWVVVTFDDGNLSDYAHALPLLRDRSYSATFYVCAARIDAEGGLAEHMLREMRDAGLHIGSHGSTHRFLSSLSAAEEDAELKDSRARLEAVLREPVTHFAPPGGRYARRTVIALKRAGYVAVGTSDFGLNDGARASFLYRRIPVMLRTSMGHFVAASCRRRARLAPLYARSAVLGGARRLFGERLYRAARSGSLGART